MRFSDEPEYMTMYKSLTNEVKESIKTDKGRAWQEQIDKLDGSRNGTEFWNSFFRLTGASLEKVHNVHHR